MELAFIIRVHAVGLDFPDTRRPRMLQETGATERERPAQTARRHRAPDPRRGTRRGQEGEPRGVVPSPLVGRLLLGEARGEDGLGRRLFSASCRLLREFFLSRQLWS